MFFLPVLDNGRYLGNLLLGLILFSLHEMRKNGKRTSPKILKCSDPGFSAYGTVPYSIQAKNWKKCMILILENFFLPGGDSVILASES
jgi:hypothetical protein